MRLPAEFDLNALELFVLTVELGGMTACAQQMRITQSAVSQTITRLEQRLGTPLFDRTLRPLGLTPAGRALHERARDLLTHARTMYEDVLAHAERPIDRLVLGMSESLATLLTAPLLSQHRHRVRHWHIRSGISLNQQQDFMARRCDMLITGSSTLEKLEGIEHFPIAHDPFVLIFPADYSGSVDPADIAERLPFVRYSLDSGMGQRIQSQLTRMKWRVPNSIEVDIIHQQLTTVALGIGWSITSLLCLSSLPWILPQLRVEPLPRGRFARRIQVVARHRELADLPQQTAALGRKVIEEQTLPPLLAQWPWMETLFGGA